MDYREKKLRELMKDEAFVKELSAKIEAEDAQKYFAEHGVDFTMEEIKAIGSALNCSVKSNGELSEDDLEQVSGGCLIFGIISGIVAGAALIGTIYSIGRDYWGW